MDTQITITSSQETVILAYGTSSSPKRFWFWGALGLIGALVVGLIIFFLLLRTSFFFPKNTVAVFVTTPNAVQKLLPKDTLAQLPSPWRETLSKPSSWPVVLGLAQKQESFIPFSLAPRWIETIEPSETRGLIRFSGALSTIERDREETRYTAFFWQKLRHPFTPVQAHVKTLHLFPASVSSTTFDAHLTDRLITTNIPFSTINVPLVKSDLAFSVSEPISHTLLETVRRTFFPTRGFPPRDIPLESISIDMGDDGEITHLLISGPSEFTDSQKSALLGSLGIYNTEVFALPDGSNAIFDVLKPNPEAAVNFEDWIIRFEKNKLYLAKKNTTTTSEELLQACTSRFQPALRLSKETIQHIFQKMGSSNVWPTAAIQIGSKNGNLAVCFE